LLPPYIVNYYWAKLPKLLLESYWDFCPVVRQLKYALDKTAPVEKKRECVGIDNRQGT